MIYLDNSATTKPDSSVLASFQQVNEKYFANPSSIHQLGGKVEQLQKRARSQAAEIFHIQPEEVIFTSGGTEANNLAIKGIALQHKQRGNHIITTKIEHPSVFETCQSLEKLGFHVTYLPVDRTGLINLEQLKKAITDETILISIMHVNNELGTIQPIDEIGEIAKKYPKLFFHVDAVQGFGKVPLKLLNSGIDLCSFSGHKIHGLKGTGMLYVKSGTSLFPLFHGGQQEFSRRAGTENVAGHVAFVRALRLMKEKQETANENLLFLANFLKNGLEKVEGVMMNSSEHHAPHIMNISVPGIKPEILIHALFEQDIVVSTQSACSSKQLVESRILKACGFNYERTISSIRISLSYETTQSDLTIFLNVLEQTIAKLKDVLR